MNASAREHWLAEFARSQPGLPGRGLPWLERARASALARFADLGLPTRHDEEWKYTSVAAIESSRFSLLPAMANGVDAAAVAPFALAGAKLMVFVDGRFAPQLSRLGELPAGVTLLSLAEVLANDPEGLEGLLGRPLETQASGFAALNAAFLADGAYLHLAPGAVLEAPIQLLFLAREANLAAHSRNLVIAEADSSAHIVEHHAALTSGAYLTNALTDIVAGPGARIEHQKLQQEGAKAYHIAAINAEQGRGSRFTSGSFALGGALARVDVGVTLNAEDAECALDGLYLTDGRQHIDHHTSIDHARPRCTSREFYKGVLAGASRAVFNGKVIVRPDAQQSDAFQINRNLLLSEFAEIDTKPQLEIWADDVKCGHGATVGQLDPDQVFYLRSRGIDDRTARALLTFGFAAEVLERISLAPLKARLDTLLRGQLPAAVKELL